MNWWSSTLVGERSFTRPRRFVPRGLARRPSAVVSEGRSREDVRHRELSFRRVLALADVLAAAVVLALLLVIFPLAEFNSAMLISVPFIVVVSKVVGLYDRDELVLSKSTLDEAPTLLHTAGLFAFVVWLLHDGLGAVGPRREARSSGCGPRCSARCS